ncbi:DNA-directed RNA polymerase subunit alpha C-terminal domain-containing protein [Butyrivibrio sp. INlla21]|uniref:DNA-directed RNA polymerase subunit alpha C-terminal domain-containing protein n=1 Tax=Butyrivibrio sp. INlla21 TaxID=1520811 RepID=UPI0008E6F873|nr:DNA-directed RNA polymerase subunit alpha C-terminal domain-containing protein [Butyrivibrio sp. INlla21]SFV01048.1 Sigma-70, region 4 [Butyrivibrio sp. INlla21]
MEQNNFYIRNCLKGHVQADDLQESKVESNYFFVSLYDNKAELEREPRQGYFALISAIFGEKNLVTYKAFLDHYETYLGKAIDVVLDTLTEREKEIIIKRYGIKNGRQRTLEDVGQDYYLSRERIRQIETTALRKMRHPSRSRVIRKALLNKEYKINDKIDIGQRRCFEELIRNEITVYKKSSAYKKDDFLFYKLLTSPRFSSGDDYYGEDDIKELNLSVRTSNCLKRAQIDSLDDFMRLTMHDMSNIKNLGRKSIEEIIEKQEEMKGYDATLVGMEQYDLDEENSFSIEKEIPITRTMLSAKDMLELLQQGFFYVSDLLDYYDIIAPRDEEGNKLHILLNEHALRVIRYYSSPVLRIKLSTKLQQAMRKRGVTNIRELAIKHEVFPEDVQTEIISMLQIIKDICLEYSIEKVRDK